MPCSVVGTMQRDPLAGAPPREGETKKMNPRMGVAAAVVHGCLALRPASGTGGPFPASVQGVVADQANKGIANLPVHVIRQHSTPAGLSPALFVTKTNSDG